MVCAGLPALEERPMAGPGVLLSLEMWPVRLPALEETDGHRVWLLTRESPRNFGRTFSLPSPCCARAAVPRGRWVYERETSAAP